LPSGHYGIGWTIAGMSYRDTPITWQRIFVPPSDRVLEIAPGRGVDLAAPVQRQPGR